MGKRKRSGKDKGRATKRKKTGGISRTFVARSAGTPLAITERKYFDSQLNAGTVAADLSSWAGMEQDPATLATLFAPIQGDDYLNRQGRKVQVLALKIRGFIDCPAQTNQTAADTHQLVRLILLIDKQTNATQLNSEDVITSGTGNVAIEMFQNPAFFGRFKILKDKSFIMQNPTIAYDGTNIEQSGICREFKWNIKFRKPVVIHFNSTNGGSVADIVDNSFHMIANSNNTALGSRLSYKCRTTFIDM